MAELTRLVAKPQAGMEPFTTRNENTFPACPSFAANITMIFVRYSPTISALFVFSSRISSQLLETREEQPTLSVAPGNHLVFADLTICEKYRWMPR
jgi:hypothetical protein